MPDINTRQDIITTHRLAGVDVDYLQRKTQVDAGLAKSSILPVRLTVQSERAMNRFRSQGTHCGACTGLLVPIKVKEALRVL